MMSLHSLQSELELFVNNPARLAALNDALHKASVALEQTMHPLPQEGLSFVSDADLCSYLERHHQAHRHCEQFRGINLFSLPTSEVHTHTIRDLITGRLRPEMDVARAVAVLLVTAEHTVDEQDQRAFLSLAQELQKNPHWTHTGDVIAQASEEWANRAQALNAKTCFIGVMDGKPIQSLAQTVQEIQRYAQTIGNIEQHLREADAQRAQDLIDREQLITTLALSDNERAFMDAYRDALWVKAYHRRAQQYAFYRLEPILEDVARRLGVDVEAVRPLSLEEIQRSLLNKQVVPVRVRQQDSRPTQLRGMTACRGYATGEVYIVRDAVDVAAMPDRAILLVGQARPEYTTGFSRAAAVVCDQGGVTSHAAIIAREYGVPCVVATKCALEVFKNGMRVEVDANRAEIRLLC